MLQPHSSILSDIKQESSIKHVTTWMDLGKIMLSDRIQPQNSAQHNDIKDINKLNAPNHRAGGLKHCLGQEQSSSRLICHFIRPCLRQSSFANNAPGIFSLKQNMFNSPSVTKEVERAMASLAQGNQVSYPRGPDFCITKNEKRSFFEKTEEVQFRQEEQFGQEYKGIAMHWVFRVKFPVYEG